MKKTTRIIVPVIVIIIAVAVVGIIAVSYRPEEPGQTQEFSEEQAEARLKTLQDAQADVDIEVQPMQFFVEEVREDTGTFTVTAITYMRAEDISDVSFRVSRKAPDAEFWYDAVSKGIGRFQVTCSVGDLGHQSGTYTIEAFITPRGGDEEPAGQTQISIKLKDHFYSEALGEGRQSLVFMNPQVSGKLTGVKFKVWSEESDQEDLKTYTAEETSRNKWVAEMSLSDFPHEGDFIANAYAVIDGKEVGIASEEFELLPEPVEVPEGSGEVFREGDRVYVKVPEILQNPELPTGCESVSLTIVLSSLGYELAKTDIANKYLPRGTNLATTYVGDPFSKNGAGCFPPAIVDTANAYLEERGDERRGHNITGTTMDQLCEYIDNGMPVILWSSMYMAWPKHMGNFSTHQGQTYEWYSSEHCVVLYGYDRSKHVYLVSDPLVGLVERNETDFAKIYDEIGKYAAVIY